MTPGQTLVTVWLVVMGAYWVLGATIAPEHDAGVRIGRALVGLGWFAAAVAFMAFLKVAVS